MRKGPIIQVIKKDTNNLISSFTIHHLAFIILLLVSCKTVEPLDDVTVNLNLWNEKKIENYSFSFKRVCFCPLEYVGPNQVVVQNGKVTTVNGAAYNSSLRYGVIPTIPELLLKAKVLLPPTPEYNEPVNCLSALKTMVPFSSLTPISLPKNLEQDKTVFKSIAIAYIEVVHKANL